MNRKLFTIMLIMTTIISLSFSLFPQVAWAGTSMEYIKVGLKYGSGAVSSCTISCDTNLALGTVSDSGFSLTTSLSSVNKLNATVENGVIVLKDVNGNLLSADLGADGCIFASNYDNGGVISLDGTLYRGGIMLRPTTDNKITVINFLSLENYLYGVVPSEMGASYPIEALKAQAVAARSYAAANAANHSSTGFNMCSTIHCQVYKGYSGEYANTNKAVDETKGLVIYSEGKPVTAFYSKNSGGYTQNSEDVWLNVTAYLKSVKDTYSPDYPWNATITFEELQGKLEKLGYQPGTIQSVAITKRTNNGAILEVKITGSNNEVVLKKDVIRTTFGGTVVKSLMFNFVDAVSTSSGTIADFLLTISNGSSNVKAGEDLYMINGDGVVSKKTNADFYGYNGSSTTKLQGTSSNTGGNLELVTKSPLSIVGKGYGHGVGMAQDGAIAMANQGFTYDQILKFYYTGIEIQ